MTDTVAKLVRDVLTPVPDTFRTRYAALFAPSAGDFATVDAALAKEFPEAARRRAAIPTKVGDYAVWATGDRDEQAVRRALDGFITQYAAGVKQVHNPDLRYDTYLPSVFYDWLARPEGRQGATDDGKTLARNWGQALTTAGQPDVSYTDSQLFFPVAIGDRWALMHVSYVEDRITLFDPAGSDDAQAKEALDVVLSHIAASERAHFDKDHKLETRVMPVSTHVPADLSALVVCAALEVFPTRHYRDESSPVFDKLVEAIQANTPVYDLLGGEGESAVLTLGSQDRCPKATVEKGGRGLRDELLDRVKCTWATGVPMNAEAVSWLCKDA